MKAIRTFRFLNRRHVRIALLLFGALSSAQASETISISKKFESQYGTQEAKELEPVTVTLTLTNGSSRFTATDGKVTDTLLEGLKLVDPLVSSNTNCGSGVNVVGNMVTNTVLVTGAEMAVLSSCSVSFDVISPHLPNGTPQKNIISQIDIGNFEAKLNNVNVKNTETASATLLLKSNDVSVSHNYIYGYDTNSGAGTAMNGWDFYNEGEKVFLVTTLTNDSYVPMTSVGFKVDSGNDALTIVSSKLHTTCKGGTVTSSQEPLNKTKIILSGATLPAQSSCEVSVQVDRFPSPYEFKPLGYGTTANDFFDKNIVTTAENFTNPLEAEAIVRVIGGGHIDKYFCDDLSNSNCMKSKRIASSNQTASSYVRLNLKNYNTDSSAFRSKFVDELPAGMTLHDSVEMKSSCSELKIDGIANESSFAIDATAMKWAPDDAGEGVSTCDVYVKVKVKGPVSTNTEIKYQNSLFAGNDDKGVPIVGPTEMFLSINGGHSSNPDGFTSYLHSSELIIFERSKLGVKKSFSKNEVSAGQPLNMLYTLTNSSSETLKKISFTDDLSQQMKFDTFYPFIFDAYKGKDVKMSCKTGGTNVPVPGTPNLGSYSTGDQALKFTDITLPPDTVCIITIPLVADSEEEIKTYQHKKVSNKIDVSFVDSAGSALSTSAVAELKLKSRIFKRKYFSPEKIVKGGSSKLEIIVAFEGSEESADIVDFEMNDPLPSGMTIAAAPNAKFTCEEGAGTIQGETVIAIPGSSTFTVKADKILMKSKGNICKMLVDVKIEKTYPNSQIHNHATFTAKEGPGPLEGHVINSSSNNLTATLNLGNLAQLGLNQTVSAEEVGIGGTVRLSINIDNNVTDAVDLSKLTLVNNLRNYSGSNLLLVNPENATFGDDETGSQSSGKCVGGMFGSDTSREKITLSGVSIKAGVKCVFAFDITSQVGGAWINEIDAESITTFEGVTNPKATQKSVSFSGSLLIGAKKLVESLVNNKDGTFTVTYLSGVKNFGAKPLSKVSMTDDLTAEFGALSTDYEITEPPSLVTTASTITLNTNFNGDSDKNLASDGTLALDEEILVRFTVKFTPVSGKHIFKNSVRALGENNLKQQTGDDSNDLDYMSGGKTPATDNEPTIFDILKIGQTKPSAIDDTYVVDVGKTVVLKPLDNDSDPENDPLTIVSINGTKLTSGTAQVINVPDGMVNIDAASVILFTPDIGFTGQVTFPYVITDGNDTATANEIITVGKVVISPSKPVPSLSPAGLLLIILTMVGFTVVSRRL